MGEFVKYGWWTNGAGWGQEDALPETRPASREGAPLKTVMVYRLDKKTMGKEPVGIIVERRSSERGDNAVGMLRRARKEFSDMAPEPSSIVIGDYV